MVSSPRNHENEHDAGKATSIQDEKGPHFHIKFRVLKGSVLQGRYGYRGAVRCFQIYIQLLLRFGGAPSGATVYIIFLGFGGLKFHQQLPKRPFFIGKPH